MVINSQTSILQTINRKTKETNMVETEKKKIKDDLLISFQGNNTYFELVD